MIRIQKPRVGTRGAITCERRPARALFQRPHDRRVAKGGRLPVEPLPVETRFTDRVVTLTGRQRYPNPTAKGGVRGPNG